MLDPILDTRRQMDEFKDTTDELHYHLVRAEHHAQAAHNLLYREDAPKRSVWFKMAVGRAQSILISLFRQEMRRKGKESSR